MHICVKQQIGFTTAPHFRAPAPTPPITRWWSRHRFLHVNGDDPEAGRTRRPRGHPNSAKVPQDVVRISSATAALVTTKADEPMFHQPGVYNKDQKAKDQR